MRSRQLWRIMREIGHTMQDLAIFDRAIAAHAKWKYRLFRAIDTGTSEWTVAQVRLDTRCDFGAWLTSLPLSERLSERWKKVQSLHAEFHAAASEVLELALAGRKEEATAAIALGSRFATISAELTLALTDWKETASGR
jgi:methyl-accepting chemotaxis protein